MKQKSAKESVSLSCFIVAMAIVFATIPCGMAWAQSSKDTLIIGYLEAASTLLPGASGSRPNVMANLLIYDALVIQDFEGNIHPLLAKKWDVSADGKTWTFHLRDDVTFHSGRKFTSKDVKAHFDHWKTLPTAAKIGSLEETLIIDDYTVQFKLKSANIVFLSMIAQTEWSYGSIPDSEMVKKYGKDYGILPESVSGTGPFKLNNWVRNDRVELVRNPDYAWGPSFYQNRGPAHLQKVIFRTIPEESSRSAALERREIDMDIGLSPKDAAHFRNMKGMTVIERPKNTINHCGFNHTNSLWKDQERLRRALIHAVDQQVILDVVHIGSGKPSVGFWAESVIGHTPKGEMQKLVPQYDPEMAKRILTEEGWTVGRDGIRVKDGKPLSFTVYVYNEIWANIMTVVQEMWRTVGVDAKVRLVEFAAWKQAITAKEHDMYCVDGTHNTADIAFWFICDSIPYPNFGNWCDPKTEEFYKITQTTVNPAEREKAFQGMEKDFITRSVLIPMPHTTWLAGVWDNVKGVKLHPVTGTYKFLDAKK
jgi:peptide/nickel transport system substrate-binding protein